MFEKTNGSRAEVWHGTAKKTPGGLTKSDLLMNKHGRIVSKAKHNTAKREKRLAKAGYLTKKGQFGFIKKGSRKQTKRSRGSRKHRGGSVNYSLSPSPISGIKGTSGVGLQFVAGNAA